MCTIIWIGAYMDNVNMLKFMTLLWLLSFSFSIVTFKISLLKSKITTVTRLSLKGQKLTIKESRRPRPN